MPHTGRVFKWFESNLEMFRKDNPRSLMYIGWRHDCKPWWYDFFCKELGIEHVTVLDIFAKNIADFELQVWAGRYDASTIHIDVREIDRLPLKEAHHDVVFWDHGPEHVSEADLITTTSKLKKITGKTLIYCCPWGNWPQGIEDGNVHEIHVNAVTEDQFRNLGLETFTFERPGVENEGELVGVWKNDRR